MTSWQEFKDIWDTDGWGQPRTILSKIALCFYFVYVAAFIVVVMIQVEIIEPCYNAIKQFFKKFI
jgi:hypothetical protein